MVDDGNIWMMSSMGDHVKLVMVSTIVFENDALESIDVMTVLIVDYYMLKCGL